MLPQKKRRFPFGNDKQKAARRDLIRPSLELAGDAAGECLDPPFGDAKGLGHPIFNIDQERILTMKGSLEMSL
jgi:hypothetical protein